MTSLKVVLATMGIRNLIIRFDCERKNIEAKFQLYGQDCQKQISFQEVEDVFTDSDSANVTPSNLDVPTLKGSSIPSSSK